MMSSSSHIEPASAFFGAAPDTGNLGVSALCYSVLAGLRKRGARRITVFDHSRGAGALPRWDDGISRAGAFRTRRWYRPESHFFIGAAAALHVPAGEPARRILRSEVFLDISGGDSFTDLYGLERYRSVAWPKLLAARLRKRLILLPQTYGPFRSPEIRASAAAIVRHAEMCWARDERSFEILRDLLGDRFDPLRHRVGVDVAFLLETRAPGDAGVALGDALSEALGHRDDGPLVGLNPSGLIYNDPARARDNYRFRADYAEALRRTISGLTQRGARVVLIPHVVTPRGHYESDTAAAESVRASLGREARSRVLIAPEFADPREVKWLIAQMEWFCGTRMHSTIAGLSSGVPTATISYSDKARGVFESCGQGREVVDPRELDTDDVDRRTLESFDRRAEIATTLGEHLPAVLGLANEQMEAIAERCGANPVARS